MDPLLDKCCDFAKLSAVSIKTVKTDDERLMELSNLKGFDERVEYAQKETDWEELGSGSSRYVFRISNSLIIKIPYNKAGIAQSEFECNPKFNSPCTNGILISDPQHKWVITRWTNNITEKEFEEIIGYNFKQVAKSWYFKFNNEIHEGKPRLYNEIIQLPLYRCISKLISETDLQIGDISKISSWCELDGKILLRDFGLSKDIWKKYYNDEGNVTSTL